MERVILKSLAKNPEDRFASAGEMVKALQSATEPPTIAKADAPQPPEPEPRPEPTPTPEPEDLPEPEPEAVVTAVSPSPPSPPPQPQPLPKTEATTVLSEPAEAAPLPTPIPVPAPKRKKRRPLLWAGLGLIAIIILGIIIVSLGGGDDEPDEYIETESVDELLTIMDEAYANDDLDLALTAVSQAIELEPDNADLRCQRGYVFRDMEEFEEAVDAFEECLILAEEQQLTHTQSDAIGEMALTEANLVMEETDDIASAIAVFDEALQNPNAPPWLICERGEYNTWHNNQAALEDFEVCQAQNPDDDYWPWRAESVASMLRGDEAMENEDYYVAIDNYQRWADLVPDIPWPYCNIGDAHASMSEFEQAAGAYEQCLQRAGDDPEMQNIAQGNLAYVSARMALFDGDLGAALEQITQAIEFNPDDGWLYCERGIIFNEMGAIDEARADYEMCLELLQHDPDGRAWADELLNSLE
jgi:tetratricopeptide (TPR) repeat protein